MGIDYVVDYDCPPKQTVTLPGLMGRLKGRDRAEAIIELYRRNGDHRPVAEMGFEMARRLPDGTEEVEIVLVQDLLDAAEDLVSLEGHCEGCPANRIGVPFGCIGTINYPISVAAERWLLDQLPDHNHPLPYMLLQRAIREIGFTGEAAHQLRVEPGIYFDAPEPLERDLGAMRVNGNQLFELLFLSGAIQPAHGTMLLQFFGGVSQDLDADIIMQLADPPSDDWIAAHVPFLHAHTSHDDLTIAALKQFFHALHLAFRLHMMVLLDV
jgi:hypothetical protein